MKQITTQDFSNKYGIPHGIVYDASCACESRIKISERNYSADEGELGKETLKYIRSEIQQHDNVIKELSNLYGKLSIIAWW